MRAAATTLALIAVLLSAAPTAAAGVRSRGTGDTGFRPLRAADSTGAGSSRSPCSDGKYNFLGPSAHWKHVLAWSFRSASVPTGLSRKAVLNTIKRSIANVTGARNDCGRADAISATSSYLGTTSRRPNVTAQGGCGNRDGHSVIGFAPLGGYYAGYTCIWWIGDEIVEADMRLGSNTTWAMSASNCTNGLVMEALVTHEAGHMFGLGHVGESKHGRLTMSVYIDGLCENQEATLGLGDLKGLEALY